MPFEAKVPGNASDRLPDFIIIGAAKAGTTSLDLYLGLHPDIFMARPKEPRFFVDAASPLGNWDKGIDWYKRLFVTGKRLCGEASPQYARAPYWPGVPERMAAVVPNAKLIYLVREPMARLRSNYIMNMKRGAVGGSLAEYVDANSYALDASCYGRQLEGYLAHFPLERILVVESADLDADRLGTLRRIFRFLGADDSFFTPIFFRRRLVGAAEGYPSPLGRRIERSAVMRAAQRTMPGSLFYHVRNVVLAPFMLPDPSTELPVARERELQALFREEVGLLRRLTGLPLPSLDAD